MSYDGPIRIFIPVPCEIPRARGANSTGSYGANLRVRCTPQEYDRVRQEADALGITMSGFCRWVINHAAEALHEHRRLNLQTDNAGDTDERNATEERNRV